MESISVPQLIAQFDAPLDAESASDHITIIQATASSSAEMPQTTVPQDPCSSSPHPYLPRTISTEGTGRQAGPSDLYIVQGTASSSADMLQTTVPQDPCSSSPHVMRLEPKHKIFLSHSGKQKLFATYLCEALEKQGHEPFFDRRDSSLLKGEKFAEHIIEAAKQCEMLVVVVSEDYFMSKWTMIELSAFIQANANAETMKVLPLFFELSINEVRDEGNRQKWYKEWERFEGDNRINLEDWKRAVEQLPSFNGIPYDHGDHADYRRAIVSSICYSIPPHPKWDVNHVQGLSNICKVVRKRIAKLDMLHISNAKVIGFHGVGGVGKTTMCKVLCNEFTWDFDGRVCHLEFNSKNTNLKKLFKKALMSLSNLSVQVIERFDEDQCCAKLWSVIGEKKVFMAIDNVWDYIESDSISKAKKLMQGPFCKGSVVVVTSRSLDTLGRLSLDKEACFEVPELGKVDAINIFKYHAFPLTETLSEVESECVLKCVEKCHFEKGNGHKHYHPLALEQMGVQVKYLYYEKPPGWKAKLQRVMTFDYPSGQNRVFDILSIGFDELPQNDQNLFMDVSKYQHYLDTCDTKWLCCVHEKKKDEVQTQLNNLKRKGFLQHVEWTSQQVVMHDLYTDFASKEMTGTFNKSDLCETQKWMQMNVGDPNLKRDRNWSKLTRLHVECLIDREDLEEGPRDLRDWDWNYYHLRFERKVKALNLQLEVLMDWDLQYFSRVEVLSLTLDVGLNSSRLGVLNLEPMKCLRSISMEGGPRCFYEVKGMERLKQLYYFSWFIEEGEDPNIEEDDDADDIEEDDDAGDIEEDDDADDIEEDDHADDIEEDDDEEDVEVLTTMGKFSPSLMILQVRDKHASISSSAVDGCTQLVDLWLDCIPPSTTFNLSRLSSLKKLSINGAYCPLKFFQICGLHQHISLKKLTLGICEVNGLSQVNLENLTRLQELNIYNCHLQIQSLPEHVRRLRLCQGSEGSYLNEDFLGILKTNALRHLEDLELRFAKDFKDFKDVGGWPKLRKLQVLGCNISNLPNLSESTMLKTLVLGDFWIFNGEYEIEFGENEVTMLSGLRQLQPVHVGYEQGSYLFEQGEVVRKRSECRYYVDFPRRVLIKQFVDSKLALERELGVAPYKLCAVKLNWENTKEVKYTEYQWQEM